VAAGAHLIARDTVDRTERAAAELEAEGLSSVLQKISDVEPTKSWMVTHVGRLATAAEACVCAETVALLDIFYGTERKKATAQSEIANPKRAGSGNVQV
jgi:hypothetical protein